jgi:hypothetical protein
LPVRVLSCLFRARFLRYLKQAFDQGKLRFFPPCNPSRIPKPSPASCAPTPTANGSSTPKCPSGDPPRSSITSGAIPTASPSPITASWHFRTGG